MFLMQCVCVYVCILYVFTFHVHQCICQPGGGENRMSHASQGEHWTREQALSVCVRRVGGCVLNSPLTSVAFSPSLFMKTMPSALESPMESAR